MFGSLTAGQSVEYFDFDFRDYWLEETATVSLIHVLLFSLSYSSVGGKFKLYDVGEQLQ